MTESEEYYDHPPPLPPGTSDDMSGGSRSLRDLIEANASAAQRGPLARLRDDYDNDDDKRSETVGDAIEGAATTTSDSARQAAALVFNQPTHDNVTHVLIRHTYDIRTVRQVLHL